MFLSATTEWQVRRRTTAPPSTRMRGGGVRPLRGLRATAYSGEDARTSFGRQKSGGDARTPCGLWMDWRHIGSGVRAAGTAPQAVLRGAVSQVRRPRVLAIWTSHHHPIALPPSIAPSPASRGMHHHRSHCNPVSPHLLQLLLIPASVQKSRQGLHPGG